MGSDLPNDVEHVVTKAKRMVRAARQEADHAVAVYEARCPMAEDTDLHERMGSSFASNTFLTIRTALWRETIGALMRIWDTDHRAIRLAWLVEQVRRPEIQMALLDSNLSKSTQNGFYSNAHIRAELLATQAPKVSEVIAIYELYTSGEKHRVRDYLAKVRNEQLAHSQSIGLTSPPDDWSDEKTAEFLEDTVRMVGILLSVVESMHYDLTETAGVFAFHAKLFWASARGERTIGHPKFRPALTLPERNGK